MVAIQLNGAKAQTPQSFEELKARIFQRIYKNWDLEKPILERDYFKLFCILNDCNFDRLERTPENEIAVEELTRWVVETEPRFEVIKSFTYLGKTVEIPSDIGRLPIGQTTLVKQAIDSSRFPEQNICFAAAVYLQPLLDGSKLNYESIKKWEAVFEELPITEIFSVGFFLLNHVKKNSSGHQSVWKQIRSNLTIIRKRALRYWLKQTGYKGLIINR